MAGDLQKNADFARRNVGILRPAEFRKSVSARRFLPTERLSPLVAHYFVAHWNLPAGTEHEVSDVLSQPAVHLLFKDEDATIVGIFSEKRTLKLKGEGVYAAVRFRPGGFHAFYGAPVVELFNRQVPASRMFPNLSAAFVTRILSLSSPQRIAEELESLLLSRAPASDPKLDQIDRIIHDIENHTGTATPTRLAARHHMSVRTLQNLFSNYVGAGVKWIAIHQRIVMAIEFAHRKDKPNWTRIAFDLDYSSQSHFINEFRRVTGVSPSAYWRRLEADF